MPLDGIFLHHLTEELKVKMLHSRINKIQQINPTDFVFLLHHNGESLTFFLSAAFEYSTAHITKNKFTTQLDGANGHFINILRKRLERGFIDDIAQYDNDRVLILTITCHDELQDEKEYHLYLELMGRNSNFILTNENDNIIDALRYLVNPDCDLRLIIPKADYQFPRKTKRLNPFLANTDFLNDLEGCSNFVLQGVNSFAELTALLKKPITPTYYIQDKKTFYYCYDLPYVDGVRHYYLDLSELLDAILIQKQCTTSYDNLALQKIVKKALEHEKRKLVNLAIDLEKANNDIANMKWGLLLQAHLHELPHKADMVTLADYENETMVALELNPRKTVIENMTYYFNQAKKGKNAQIEIAKQETLANNEITYLDSLLYFIDKADQNTLNEIRNELTQNGYLKRTARMTKNSRQLSLATYTCDGIAVLVGKNHLQNDYLTNKLATKSDYWFHVKNAPGSHVVLRSNELNEERIRFCALLAATNSKAQKSSSVPVDYTQIRNLKKVPGVKGFYVTYTNYKTIYIDPE